MASHSLQQFATAPPTVVARAVPQVGPQAIPHHITQDELTLVLSLRGRLHQLESQVETAEVSIKERLEKGASVEPGNHTAELKTGYRRNVAWKGVCERLAGRFKLDGKAFVARVLAATRPTPVTSVEIN